MDDKELAAIRERVRLSATYGLPDDDDPKAWYDAEVDRTALLAEVDRLRGLVGEVAGLDPFHKCDPCTFCGGGVDADTAHEPDCLWERCRTAVGE